MFIHNDMTGQQIDVGDIVIFTEPGARRNLPSLCFGEVQGLTKASVRVFLLDKEYKRKQQEERVEDTTSPPYYVDASGTPHYR